MHNTNAKQFYDRISQAYDLIADAGEHAARIDMFSMPVAIVIANIAQEGDGTAAEA